MAKLIRKLLLQKSRWYFLASGIFFALAIEKGVSQQQIYNKYICKAEQIQSEIFQTKIKLDNDSVSLRDLTQGYQTYEISRNAKELAARERTLETTLSEIERSPTYRQAKKDYNLKFLPLCLYISGCISGPWGLLLHTARKKN